MKNNRADFKKIIDVLILTAFIFPFTLGLAMLIKVKFNFLASIDFTSLDEKMLFPALLWSGVVSYAISFAVYAFVYKLKYESQSYFKSGLIELLKQDVASGKKFGELEKYFSICLYRKIKHKQDRDSIMDAITEMLNAGEIYIKNSEKIIGKSEKGFDEAFMKENLSNIEFGLVENRGKGFFEKFFGGYH